jgi:hypothetical protein
MLKKFTHIINALTVVEEINISLIIFHTSLVKIGILCTRYIILQPI